MIIHFLIECGADEDKYIISQILNYCDENDLDLILIQKEKDSMEKPPVPHKYLPYPHWCEECSVYKVEKEKA